MMRLARPSTCGGTPADLSFAETFSQKRKADRSCLMELTEGKEPIKHIKHMHIMNEL